MVKRKITRWMVYTLVLSVLLLCVYPPSVTSIAATNNKQDKISWPKGPKASSLSCESAIVMELSSGLILYELNSEKRQYPASITKILTALLCIENASLSETVTFSEDAVYGIEADSSNQGIDVGEKLTMEQCLYCILLESANEACLGVAEHISGTQKGFVDMMNQRVEALGLTNTHFMNPNGLHHDKHYTTAYDMANIAREAMKNSTFRKITAAKTYQIPKTNRSKEIRYLRNHHQMVNGYDHPEYEYDFCIGGKTGYTQRAQSTLVTFAEKDGMELVCVVMRAASGSVLPANQYTDTIKLLNFGFENYHKYEIGASTGVNPNENPIFTNYTPFFDSNTSNLRMASQSTIVLPAKADVSLAKREVTYNQNLTLAEGENIIGTVTYTYGGKTVGSSDIIYDVEKNASSLLDSKQPVRELIKELNKEKEKRKKEKEKKKFSISKIFNKKVLITLGVAFGFIVLLILFISIYKSRRKGVRYHRRHKRTYESFHRRNNKKLHF